MSTLTVHVNGEFNTSQKQTVSDVLEQVAAIQSRAAQIEQSILTLRTAQDQQVAFDAQAFVNSFAIRNSSNNPVNVMTEGSTYIITALWVDWQGHYAFDTSSRTQDLTSSIGEVEFLSQGNGIRTYRYSVPEITADTTINFTAGKYTDFTLSELLEASVDINALDAPSPVTTPTQTLTRSGRVISARVQWPSEAPCIVYWRIQGTTEFTAASPTSNLSQILHTISFAVPDDNVIEVYAGDHISDQYSTAISSIVVPQVSTADLTGYTHFLDVGTTEFLVPTLSNASLQIMTQPIPALDNYATNQEMSVEEIDGVWALGIRQIPTPTGARGSTRVVSKHVVGEESEVYLYQRFYIPSNMDWGGEYPYSRGRLGLSVVGQFDNNHYGSVGSLGSAFFTPEWRGLPDGSAELAITAVFDNPENTGKVFFFRRGSQTSEFNSNVPRILSPGWHEIITRVKMNSTPTTADGIMQFWHNTELMVTLEDRVFVASGDPKIRVFDLNMQYYGSNYGTSNFSPDTTQTIYLADWAYKAV